MPCEMFLQAYFYVILLYEKNSEYFLSKTYFLRNVQAKICDVFYMSRHLSYNYQINLKYDYYKYITFTI